MSTSENSEISELEAGVLETLRKDLEYRSINGDENATKALRRLDRRLKRASKPDK